MTIADVIREDRPDALWPRVRYYAIKAAIAVAYESPGTVNHANRLLLAQAVLLDSRPWADSFYFAVITDPALLSAETLASVPDATVESIVNSVYDAMSLTVAAPTGAAVAMTPALLTGTLTRPANTTAYTAGDEMTDVGGSVLTIPGCARAAGGVGILDTVVVIDSMNAAVDPALDIFIFDAASIPAADNALFAPVDAAMQSLIYNASLGSAIAGDPAASGNLVWRLGNIGQPYICGPGSTSLFVRFAVRNAYVPASNETFTVRLGVRLV